MVDGKLQMKALLADQLIERDDVRTSALKSAGIGVWEIMPGKDYIYVDGLLLEHFGVVGEAGVYVYEDLVAKVHPDDRKLVSEAVAASMTDASVLYDISYRTEKPDGDYRWIRAVGRLGPAKFAEGEMTLMGTTQDVTWDKEYEAQLIAAHDRISLMAGELSHRVKNLFAIMGYLITQSGRGAATPEQAMKKARERINALSRAHALSTGTGLKATFNLGDLITEILAPYPVGDHQVTISGDEIPLASNKVTSLGIISHELATNAAKYGAYKARDRQLDVTWTANGGDVALIWMETGLEKPAALPAEGFGSKAIALSAKQLEGEMSREFFDNRMVFKLSFSSD